MLYHLGIRGANLLRTARRTCERFGPEQLRLSCYNFSNPDPKRGGSNAKSKQRAWKRGPARICFRLFAFSVRDP
jgi:hypothetical protein